MNLVDTHCHIHEANYDNPEDLGVTNKWLKGGKPNPDHMIAEANKMGVSNFICVGTTTRDSILAEQFARNRDNVWASIGIHPHEAREHIKDESKLQLFRNLLRLEQSKIVAIGECGLDYYYNHSPKTDQVAILEMQLDLAKANDLPLIFHVREAFDDFWPIFDNFKGLRGVLHSYTDSVNNMNKALARGLLIGLNGIMTFTKDIKQLDMAKAIPLSNLVLETDAPFLTPTPERGKICEPKHVTLTAEFLSNLRGEAFSLLATHTTENARSLFGLK